jgi:ribonuclease HI
MLPSQTPAISTVMLSRSCCTAVQAEAAIATLVEMGWTSPRQLPETTTEHPDVIVASAGGVLTAHTDGACSGNPGPGGWAVVFSQGGDVVSEHAGSNVGVTTSNQMELMAIRQAVSRAPSDVDLEIVTDSQNAIGTDSQNAIGWLSRGWKRNNPAIAAFCRDIEMLAAKRSGKVSYRHVRGHKGDSLNERADKLATGAIPGRV